MTITIDEFIELREEFSRAKTIWKMKSVAANFRDTFDLHHLKGWEIFDLLRENGEFVALIKKSGLFD
jgi:hypothetical protein